MFVLCGADQSKFLTVCVCKVEVVVAVEPQATVRNSVHRSVSHYQCYGSPYSVWSQGEAKSVGNLKGRLQ